MSLIFEGIVTSDIGHPINPKGEKGRLIAILPPRAKDLPPASYKALQLAYNGELEILDVGERVFVEQTVTVASIQGLRTHRRRLVNMIHTHLDIVSTVQ